MSVLIRIVALLLLHSTTLSHPSTHQREAQGTIRGSVVALTTGTPIRHAIVRVYSEGRLRSWSSTDDRGMFDVSQLTAGRYMLSASKAGYVESQYGAPGIGWPGRSLVIAPGETATVSLPMVRGSVLAGTVKDASGRTLSGVTVSARPATPKAGGLSWEPSETDSLGRFRIVGLPPGDYIVRGELVFLQAFADLAARGSVEVDEFLRRGDTSSPGRVPERPMPSATKPSGFSPVYYPSTWFADAATVVTVNAEDTVEGLDMTLIPARRASISGTVTATKPFVQARVMLDEDANGVHRSLTTDASGTFEFRGLPPGRYVIRAQVTLRSEGGATLSGDQADAWYAVVETTANGDDVTGVDLRAGPGARIAGQMTMDDASRAMVNGFRLKLHPVGRQRGRPLLLSGDFAMERTVPLTIGAPFAITGLPPGRYAVAIEAETPSLGSNVRALSALWAGADLLDAPLELGAGTDVKGIEVIVSNTHTRVLGRVVTGEGEQGQGCLVVALSTNLEWQSLTSRRTRVITPDADGQFVFADLPQGEYVVAALTPGGANGLTDDVVRLIAKVGLPVRVTDGKMTDLGDLKLIR